MPEHGEVRVVAVRTMFVPFYVAAQDSFERYPVAIVASRRGAAPRGADEIMGDFLEGEVCFVI